MQAWACACARSSFCTRRSSPTNPSSFGEFVTSPFIWGSSIKTPARLHSLTLPVAKHSSLTSLIYSFSTSFQTFSESCKHTLHLLTLCMSILHHSGFSYLGWWVSSHPLTVASLLSPQHAILTAQAE